MLDKTFKFETTEAQEAFCDALDKADAIYEVSQLSVTVKGQFVRIKKP